MAKQKVAMLTAGGLAPCLSSAVGGLIERYTDIAPEVEIIAYTSGYRGLLMDYKIEITREMREKAHLLHRYGGSPIGNSRVKLTNVADCVKRGLVKEGETPLRVAAERLAADGVTINGLLPGVFATPLYVDWGKSSISRGIGTNPSTTWHYVSAHFTIDNAKTVPAYFRLSTQDSALADRIEYAMKFLQMSCDISAKDGF